MIEAINTVLADLFTAYVLCSIGTIVILLVCGKLCDSLEI